MIHRAHVEALDRTLEIIETVIKSWVGLRLCLLGTLKTLPNYKSDHFSIGVSTAQAVAHRYRGERQPACPRPPPVAAINHRAGGTREDGR
ncbi:hypothetical protein EVAR_22993_1 [Eumeta japonica]|uniref:Uncharacterized protein n=1 Tax=Eumeta variegata TaxID=151549 RepID=A0A4C1UQC0_EUMVA|nr:hypothetical protein EVAR_22993_1 [Eumeta japonica]